MAGDVDDDPNLLRRAEGGPEAAGQPERPPGPRRAAGPGRHARGGSASDGEASGFSGGLTARLAPLASRLAPLASRAGTALKPWLKALEPQSKRVSGPPGTETEQQLEQRETPPEIRRKRLLMALGAAAVVLVVALALTRQREPQSGAVITPLAEQGQVITQGEVSAAVMEVDDQFVPNDEKRRAQPGRRLIAVKFKLSNESRRTIRVRTGDQFAMLDAAGHRFPANTRGAPDPLFRDGDLEKGDSREGWVSFEVPADGTGFKMMFLPAVARPAD